MALHDPTGTTLYVHVPFCVVKCGYCDFNSYEVDDRSVLDAFIDGLARELELTALPAEPPSIFIGGGTPTFLEPDRLARLLEVLARHVDLRACAEVTMEANPESVTEQKARIARQAGVRRFSLGAQSFAPQRLRFLDRAHSAARIGEAVAELRAGGCENLNLDLMFGIPGQTLADWERDLEAALELQPDHLSCYNLTFEAGTRLERERRAGRVAPNDEQVDRAMFLRTRDVLASAGFVPYEVSNFAGRGGPCRHNDHYWLQGDYVGVGPGASSHRAGVRSTNLKPLEQWRDSLDRELPPVAEAETLSPRQRAGEALWLGLRRTDGVDLAAVEARLQAPVGAWLAQPLEELAAQALIVREGARVRLTSAGLLFANEVGERFLAGERCSPVGSDCVRRQPP
jgi:oxygen-independent coproporphyrinogen-3 oxidase